MNCKKAILSLLKRTKAIEDINRIQAFIEDVNSKASIWRGTQAQYDLIDTPDDNTIYIITP